MEIPSDKAFIERTNKLIKQYTELDIPEKDRYDITLRLNACIGLLFVGHEKSNYNIPDYPLEKIGLKTSDVLCCTTQNGNDEEINAKSVCHHIRNAIAHARFKFMNQNKTITSIRFIDQANSGSMTFDLTLSCDDFIKFTDWLYSVFKN